MRIAAVAVASAALVAAGATAAVAAPAPAPSITVKASATKIQLGDVVTFSGKAVGLDDGSKVTLQVKDGKNWKALPDTAKLKKGAYKLDEKFDDGKGVVILRAKDGKTVSKTVSVTVR
ncbi:hypothetical protein ACGF3G_02655 [Streptomyces sp. NPDC048179]|uniref:hypothetical protein n=1 Tax=Streptomyces sp. NPDC048179 TaxID=3365506 RepID=UPI003715BA2C